MKTRVLSFILLFILLTSCDNYKCVVYYSNGSTSEYTFREKDNPSAYESGLTYFLICQSTSEELSDRIAGYPSKKAEQFYVFDRKGNLVTSEGVPEDTIDELRASLSGTSYQQSKIDSTKIAELTPYFKIKQDEFDPKAPVWYEPKSAPQYTNRNGIYCYFRTIDNKPQNFRFRMQYYADDWLFFHKVQFSIDEKAYEYIPNDTETDSGNGGKIWEWFDDAITTSSDKELIRALANAKTARMKIIGKQYYDIKEITPSQIKDIKRSLELFEAMGGSL